MNLELHGQHHVDRRRSKRFDASLKVRVVARDRETIFFTRSVSRGGLFVRTAQPAGVSKVVRMRITLPHSDEEISMLGVVRWRREPGGRTAKADAGMGMSFYQLSDETRRQWNEMISSLEDCLRFDPCGSSEIPAMVVDKLSDPAQVPQGSTGRRSAPRVRHALTVSWSYDRRHYRQVTDDVSLTGFFIAGVTTVPAGCRLVFSMFSTASLEAFRVVGQIVRVDEGDRPGIAVQIVDHVDGSRDRFHLFLTPELVATIAPEAQPPGPGMVPAAAEHTA